MFNKTFWSGFMASGALFLTAITGYVVYNGDSDEGDSVYNRGAPRATIRPLGQMRSAKGPSGAPGPTGGWGPMGGKGSSRKSGS